MPKMLLRVLTRALFPALLSVLLLPAAARAESEGIMPTPSPAPTMTPSVTPTATPTLQPVLLGSAPQTNWLTRVDPATGFATVSAVITGASGNITEIEFSPDGSTLYATSGGGSARIHTIDPLTGAVLTSIPHASGSLQGLEFDSMGRLLGTFFSSSLVTRLVEVNPATGALTDRGSTGLGFPLGGLAFSPGFGFLYAISSSGALGPVPPRIYSIDPSNAVVTFHSTTDLPDEASSLEFLPDGRLVAACADGALYEIDPDTGATTLIGPLVSVGKLSGLTWGLIPPPPPCCPGDADNSGGFVDAADFIRVQSLFGTFALGGATGDGDCGGGFIDAADFIAVQAAFGRDCP